MKRHIDFGMAWKGALFLGLVVFGINAVEHGALAALPAALKQGTYTYLVAGFITRLGENLAVRLEPAALALATAVLIPSCIAISLTFGLHSLRGTPEPLYSTLPTVISAPPAFLVWGWMKRRARDEDEASKTPRARDEVLRS
jgi:hypothetical protein